jgi:hypothetical protein
VGWFTGRSEKILITGIPNQQLENVDYFNYLGSRITNDARCTRQIKSRIAMAKAAFNKKKTFHQQTGQ